MRIALGQLKNPTADLVDLGILVPVVVAWDDVDCVDAVCIKEIFAEPGAIQRAVVCVGLERHDATGAGMPPQVLYQKLRASKDFHGGRRGGRLFGQRRGRSMKEGSMTPYGTTRPASTVSDSGEAQKGLWHNAVGADSNLMPSKCLRAKDE